MKNFLYQTSFLLLFTVSQVDCFASIKSDTLSTADLSKNSQGIEEITDKIYKNYWNKWKTYWWSIFPNKDFKTEIFNKRIKLDSIGVSESEMNEAVNIAWKKNKKNMKGMEQYNKTNLFQWRKRHRILMKTYQYILLEKPIDEQISELGLLNEKVNEDTLKNNLSQVRTTTYTNLFLLYDRLKFNVDNNYNNDINKKDHFQKNLKLVANRLDEVISNKYSQYKYSTSSNQLIKGISFYHDNDIIAMNLFDKLYPNKTKNGIPAQYNLDKNYTGGAGLEIATDLLKMRLFPTFSNNRILSYQSVFFGIEAYTPFIRIPLYDNNGKVLKDAFGNPKNETTLKQEREFSYANDRPFASFRYFGRAKYRINPVGSIRSKSQFKVGKIGGDLAYNVQKTLHRDQIQSPEVFGWDTQIGSPGRFAWNIDHNIDLMIISKASCIFRNRYRFEKYEKNTENYKSGKGRLPENQPKSEKEIQKIIEEKEKSSKNFYLPTEFHIGNELTAVGVGLGFSNKDFKKRSGRYDFLPINRNPNKNPDNGLHISIEARYRYVIHNSLLEGFGVTSTYPVNPHFFIDETVKVPIKDSNGNIQYLEKFRDNRISNDEMKRHIFYLSSNLSYRFKKSTFYFDLNYNTREFNRNVNLNYKNYDWKFYGWGRIGASFLL